MAFFDELAGLCGREMQAAKLTGDTDRLADMVEGLATTLGRLIAVVTDGEPGDMGVLLAETHAYLGEAACEVAPTLVALRDARHGSAGGIQ